MTGLRPFAVVRGANDVASATALGLATAGYAVLLVDIAASAVTRRGQSFADAVFDGTASLEGVNCRRAGDAATWVRDGAHDIGLTTQPLDDVLEMLAPEVLVDARMKKRAVPEDQRGLAPLVVGLGPNFIAGGNVDRAVETAWGALGYVIGHGPTSKFAGEPKPVGGYGRERYIYAPAAGVFRSGFNIGDAVREGETVAHLVTRNGELPIPAPKSGILRGLVHDGVEVASGSKSVEVVPADAKVFGVGERPSRITEGVVSSVRGHFGLLPLGRATVAGVLRNAEAGDLPLFAATLGLSHREFTALVETLQFGARMSMPDFEEGYALCAAQEPDLYAPLARLLWEHRAPDMAESPARWLAHAVAAAGFGCRHLWQDLGLSGRAETTAMLHLHFPGLAARNSADLKWKRYLFLALGERLGLNDLKPPGCTQCDTYSSCHGPVPGSEPGRPSGHRPPPLHVGRHPSR